MAKQVTKAQLLEEIEILKSQNKQAEAIVLQRDAEIKSEQEFNKSILQTIAGMLQTEYRVYSEKPLYMHENINTVAAPTPKLSEIAFRIGKLVVIEKEYEELKDRSLPVPKMRALREERESEIRNEGRRI